MENLVNPAFWRGRRVFLTGHTGFKGGWLALWLQQMGAELTGYALAPETSPNLFTVADVGRNMTSLIGDIRDAAQLQAAVHASRPEVVLHLAAQALVSEGYNDPLGTYATNVQGTANLLEAARHTPGVRVVVVVTSDKCYENREWPWPYRENEALGGHDPYSSSKACAELVTASYRKSFLAAAGIAAGSARAGNVFGGGDWSANRLVPDLLAAFAAGQSAELRRPQAVRPWQHALEPLAGYLQLSERLYAEPGFADAWNFGPAEDDCLSAGQLADQLAAHWGAGAGWHTRSTDFPHEAGLLRLDASRARQLIGWHPRWPLSRGLAATVAWQQAWLAGRDMHAFTLQQIAQYAS